MYYVLRKLFDALLERYIWMDVELIAETKKAILVKFDGQSEWIPKSWLSGHKDCERRHAKIRISESHWARKFG